ncbi:hypothetical protein [Microbacterium flavum]|uniref:Uncharacterized protein n=1 Tax=Microbacterium flavum TaxID=415216 RepID=A0ABS5XSF4_9MICO|nr:hypothetical protein [Microbacterium flavum]MBT8797460.1 hypothetical protein [Microbacterium flavum]
MTEHIPFFVGHPMLVRDACQFLDDEATIRAVEFYNVSPVAKSDDARCPLL